MSATATSARLRQPDRRVDPAGDAPASPSSTSPDWAAIRSQWSSSARARSAQTAWAGVAPARSWPGSIASPQKTHTCPLSRTSTV
jgi:hypothetical protein